MSNYEQFVHNLSQTKVNAILSLQYLQKQLISQINKNAVLYLQHCIKNTEKCIFNNVLFLQYRGVVSDNCRTNDPGTPWSTTIPQPHQSPFPNHPLPSLFHPSLSYTYHLSIPSYYHLFLFRLNTKLYIVIIYHQHYIQCLYYIIRDNL